VSYRIEVGHQHGATPREIVGAIANEAGLEGRYIGRIDIQEDHSIVDLPKEMSREVVNHLKRVFVRGQALRIAPVASAHRPATGTPSERPPRAASETRRPHRESDHDAKGEPGSRRKPRD
jgi:ATP-dependent RNA helicase DeaD